MNSRPNKHTDTPIAADDADTTDQAKKPNEPAPEPTVPGQSRADRMRGIAESQGGGIDGAVGGGQSGQGGG